MAGVSRASGDEFEGSRLTKSCTMHEALIKKEELILGLRTQNGILRLRFMLDKQPQYAHPLSLIASVEPYIFILLLKT